MWLNSLDAVKPVDDDKQITGLIALLENDQFEVREKAAQQLSKLGAQAVGRLRLTLTKNPPPETRRRIEEVLEKLKTREPSTRRSNGNGPS